MTKGGGKRTKKLQENSQRLGSPKRTKLAPVVDTDIVNDKGGEINLLSIVSPCFGNILEGANVVLSPRERTHSLSSLSDLTGMIQTASDLDSLSEEQLAKLMEKNLHPRRRCTPAPAPLHSGDVNTSRNYAAQAAQTCPTCSGCGWYPVVIGFVKEVDGSVRFYRAPACSRYSLEGHRRECGASRDGAMCCCFPPSYEKPDTLCPEDVQSLVKLTRYVSSSMAAGLLPFESVLREQRPDTEK